MGIEVPLPKSGLRALFWGRFGENRREKGKTEVERIENLRAQAKKQHQVASSRPNVIHKIQVPPLAVLVYSTCVVVLSASLVPFYEYESIARVERRWESRQSVAWSVRQSVDAQRIRICWPNCRESSGEEVNADKIRDRGMRWLRPGPRIMRVELSRVKLGTCSPTKSSDAVGRR